MVKHAHRKGLKASKEYRATARAKKLSDRPRGAQGATPLDAGETAAQRRKKIRQKLEDMSDGSRIESLTLINKEKRIKVSLPEMVDVATFGRKRNPHRMVIWSQNTPNGRFQLVYLTDKKRLYLASYQGARRDFVGIREGTLQDLSVALQVGRRLAFPPNAETTPSETGDGVVGGGSIDIDTPQGERHPPAYVTPRWMVVQPDSTAPEIMDEDCLTLMMTNRGLIPIGVNRFKSIGEAENDESI